MKYWLLPLLLVLVQFVFTYNSLGQMRSEELIESIRSVWWFQNGLVTDGGYAVLGWYALQLLFYKIFGFTIHMAKFIKLFIIAISFFALAAILKKYLKEKYAWIPLMIIGLSPTFLFLNTLQISQGIEVSYFLICLFLVEFLKFKNPKIYLPQQALTWALAMLAWLSYPSFIYYLPILGSFYLYKLWKNHQLVPRNVVISMIAFLLPLILGFLYIENRQLLLYDRIPQRGLFRSNGGFELSPVILLDNLNILKNDLFVVYDSYYYENPKVEFSDFYPVIAVGLIFFLSFYIFFKDKKYRLLIGAILFLISFYLILLNLVGPMGLGGVRRATSILLLFYGLCAIVLYYFVYIKKHKNLKFLAIGSCLTLLFHHLIVYPVNLAHLKVPTPYREEVWFNQADTPQKTLDQYIERAQKEDTMLICHDESKNPTNCGGYSLIEAGIKGACFWNNLYCHKVYGYDIKLGKFILLDFSYYDDNNWER